MVNHSQLSSQISLSIHSAKNNLICYYTKYNHKFHLKIYSLVGSIKMILVKYFMQHIRNGLIIDLIKS